MPTTNPDDAFHPSRAELRLECGSFTASNGSVFGQLNLTVTGEGAAYLSLAIGQGRKEIIAFLSYDEWLALGKAVDDGRKLLAKMYAEKRVDEYSPVVPG